MSIKGVASSGTSTTTAGGASRGVVSFKPHNNIVLTGQNAGSTYATMISCKSAFFGVRIAYQNFSTTNTLTVTAKAAAAPKANDPGNGTGANALTFVPVTFNGAATVVIPAATPAPFGGQVVPATVLSDILPIKSVSRSDVVGADPLLYIRSYSPDAFPLATIDTSRATWTASQLYAGFVRNGTDQVTDTSIAAMICGTGGAVIMPLASVDFHVGGKVARIAAFGDSLTAGTISGGTTNNGAGINYYDGNDHSSWPIAAATVFRNLGYKNLHIANWAISGQKRDTTSLILQATCPVIKPDIVVLWNRSVNSSTEYTPEQQFKFLMSDLEYCRANNIKPVVVAMHPDDQYAAATRQFVQGWGVFLDLPALLRYGPGSIYISADDGNPLPNGGINASWDSTHLSKDGCRRFAEYAVPLIASLL